MKARCDKKTKDTRVKSYMVRQLPTSVDKVKSDTFWLPPRGKECPAGTRPVQTAEECMAFASYAQSSVTKINKIAGPGILKPYTSRDYGGVRKAMIDYAPNSGSPSLARGCFVWKDRWGPYWNWNPKAKDRITHSSCTNICVKFEDAPEK